MGFIGGHFAELAVVVVIRAGGLGGMAGDSSRSQSLAPRAATPAVSAFVAGTTKMRNHDADPLSGADRSDRERTELQAALAEAQSRRGGVVVLTGPAGIGKSRLLNETRALAETLRMTVLLGRSVPSQVPVPYRPIAEALLGAKKLDAALGSADLEGFTTALRWVVPGPHDHENVSHVESPIVVAEGLLRLMQELGGSDGVVLLLEDLNCADPETLHAVEYVADHAATAPMLCVCTVRDEAKATRCTPLPAWKRDEPSRLCGCHHCPPARSPTWRLRPCAPVRSTPRSTRCCAMPQRVSPFSLRNCSRGSHQRGARGTWGWWHVAAPMRRLIPDSFAITVRQRLHGMGPDGRRILGAAALLGRRFEWRLAASAAGCSRDVTEAMLTRAVGLQLLAVQDGGFSFRHALTRDAILGELLPNERVDLATRCLDALEQDAARRLAPSRRRPRRACRSGRSRSDLPSGSRCRLIAPRGAGLRGGGIAAGGRRGS